MNSIPYTLHLGDSREVLKTLPDNSVDSIVCDPPYGLSKEPDMAEVLQHWMAGDDYTATGGGFMGKTWDSFVPGPAVWRECMRVLKPGGHLLAFFGSRTYDMGTLAIRLAGFEIRDQIMWIYGSGFPKSMDVSKAIDKAAGAEREIIAEGKAVKRMIPGADQDKTGSWIKDNGREFVPTVTAPATEAARQWEGWGTALKPAHEPICVARKPLEGTVVANVLQNGTGALNIDGCRVAFAGADDEAESKEKNRHADFNSGPRENAVFGADNRDRGANGNYDPPGRWPANIVHDGSEEVLAGFPCTGKSSGGGGNKAPGKNGIYGNFNGHQYAETIGFGDAGSAARFFYCAKAGRADRNEGVEDSGPQFTHGTTLRKVENTSTTSNHHPTVKPTTLMQWLCRLVTPPGGTVLDPFMGSGSTGKAAMLEGFQFIGIDMTPEYVDIARARIQHAHETAQKERPQLDLFAAE